MPPTRAKFMKLAFILLMFIYIQTAPTEAQPVQANILPHKKHPKNKNHESKSKLVANDDEQSLEQQIPKKKKKKTGKNKQSNKHSNKASKQKNSLPKKEEPELIEQNPDQNSQKSEIKINDAIVYQPSIKQYNGKTTSQIYPEKIFTKAKNPEDFIPQSQNENKNHEKKVAVVERDQNKINQLRQKSKNNDGQIDVQKLNKAIQKQQEQSQQTQIQSGPNDDEDQKEQSVNQQYERRMGQYRKAQDEKNIRQQKMLEQYRAKELKAAESTKLAKEEAMRVEETKRAEQAKKAEQTKKAEQARKEFQKIQDENRKKFDLFMQEKYDPQSIVPMIPKNAEQQRLMKEKQMHKKHEREFLEMNMAQDEKYQLQEKRKEEQKQYKQQQEQKKKAEQKKSRETEEKKAAQTKRVEEVKRAEQTKKAEQARAVQAKKAEIARKAEQARKEFQKIQDENRKKFDLFMQERYDPQSIVPMIPKNAEQQRLMKEKQMHKKHEREFLEMNMAQDEKYQLQEKRKEEQKQYKQQQEQKKKAEQKLKLQQEQKKMTGQKQFKQQQDKKLKSLQKQILTQHQLYTQLENRYNILQSKLDERQKILKNSQNQRNSLKRQFTSVLNQFKEYKANNEQILRFKKPEQFVPVQATFDQNGQKPPKDKVNPQKDTKKQKVKEDSDPQLQLLQKVMQNRKKKQIQVQQRSESLKQSNKTINQIPKPQDKQVRDSESDTGGVLFYALFAILIVAILYLRKKTGLVQNQNKATLYPSIQSKGSLLPGDENEA